MKRAIALVLVVYLSMSLLLLSERAWGHAVDSQTLAFVDSSVNGINAQFVTQFADKPKQNETNKAPIADKIKKNKQTDNNKGNSTLPKSRSVGHTERPKNGNDQQIKPVTNEQAKLDKGLIDAQIDDVLSSAEFLALENSTLFSSSADEKTARKKRSTKKKEINKSGQKDGHSSDDPEFLLNLLDESDLMDYVAEDDLWKEQLTIEDQP